MIGAISEWSVHPWILGNVGRWMSFYNYTLKSFGIDTMIMLGNCPVSYEHSIPEIVYENYLDLTTALEAHPNTNIVALCADGTHSPVDLGSYTHPAEDVLYIVGSDYGEVNHTVLDNFNNVDHVNIEGTLTQPLWGHVALAIAFWDRKRKG